MDTSEMILVELPNGLNARVEGAVLRDEEEVVFRAAAFGQITKAIEGIASALYEPLKKLKPTKASIEFGLQAGVDAGELIAILVKCDGSANLKIKLEWSERDACKDPKMPGKCIRSLRWKEACE